VLVIRWNGSARCLGRPSTITGCLPDGVFGWDPDAQRWPHYEKVGWSLASPALEAPPRYGSVTVTLRLRSLNPVVGSHRSVFASWMAYSGRLPSEDRGSGRLSSSA
jgi:hypothetical protein